MIQQSKAKKTLVWRNVLFFGGTSLGALVGLPLYAYFVGLTAFDWLLFAFMAATTGMATTFGYHRLFAHCAFKVHPIVKFFSVFFGAAAIEGTLLEWASQHRTHHRFVDTERDPYNIKQGFWYAHMGWFLFYEQAHDFENAKDLMSDPLIMHQHKHYMLWANGAGVVLPLLIGLIGGHFWGAFFLACCGRFVLIHQSVFLINSACHYFGKQTFDLNTSPRDSWVCALLTHGEGYHSYHHKFPSDYRNGVRWYHWDPTKWIIGLLSFFGLAYDLHRMPEVKIEEARSYTERLRVLRRIAKRGKSPALEPIVKQLHERYEEMCDCLKSWETRYLELRFKLRAKPNLSKIKRKTIKSQIKEAREEFFKVRKEWLDFIDTILTTQQAA